MTQMKKWISLIVSMLMCLSFMAVSVSATSAGEAIDELSKDGVALRFALIGDSHVNAGGQHKEYFEKALKAFDTIGGVDALGLNGDVVLFSSSLSTTPYEIINGYLEQYGYGKDEGEIPYLYAMGNHEFMQNDNNSETCAQAVSIFETQMQQPLDYHTEVNGYHLIASGGESYSCQWSAGNYNTDEAWIMSEIEAIEAAEDFDPEKPIFLMLHHPIIGTLFEGISTADRRYTTNFVDFLSKRPHVVQLTAHKHIAAQYPQTISQNAGFTAFQTPLTSTAGDRSHVHQTSFIDVTTDNKVKIYKVDLTTSTYIGEPWVIDLAKGADGFTYTTEARSAYTAAPVFAEDAAITASDVKNYSATIQYPTGTVDGAGDNVVRRHLVTVTDKETGDVLVSQYYDASVEIVPQPETLSQLILNLDAGTTYTVTVTPESMYGAVGETITGEFTTTGEKSSITVEDPITLRLDNTKVGDVAETDDGTGNITTTKSYDSLSSSGVLLRSGDYFTYPIEVGEGKDIDKAGMYRVTYRYGTRRAATVSISVQHESESTYTVADTATVLPAGNDYTVNQEYTEDDYVNLKEGTNLLKITVTAIGNNDGAYFVLPKLSRVVSGAMVNVPVGTHIYDPINKVNGTGIGSFTSNISTTTYQKTTMLTFRKGNYVVFPVSVPYTAAYKMELTEKSTKDLSSNVFKVAISEESLDAAAALTTYNVATASHALTTSWEIFTLSDSFVLEGGKTYYFKLCATAVGGNHITQVSNLKLTDNGEYGSDATLANLSVAGTDELLHGFNPDVTAYSLTTSMPANGLLTVGATTTIDGATITVGEESAKSNLTAQVEVQYGINEIPVTVDVTSVNGKSTNTYTVSVVIADTRASLGNTTAEMYVGDSTTPIDLDRLFNGTGVVSNNGAGNAGFGVNYNAEAYIVIDLGRKYDLNLFTWERTNQGNSVAGMRILGANDPLFTDAEELGVTDGSAEKGSKVATVSDHRIMKTVLSGTKAYRYVKIEKPSGTSKTFYPVKMDLYGEPITEITEDNLSVSVTVPSTCYVPGDVVIAAVYSGKEMVDVKTVTAPAGYEANLTVTKKTAEDIVKVMVWKNLRNVAPRGVLQIFE